MGRLIIKAAECKYLEYNRRLREQFINGLNDEDITAQITKELTALQYTSKVSSEQVLFGPREVEVQRPQKVVLNIIRDAKDWLDKER